MQASAQAVSISTHAPAGGATQARQAGALCGAGFLLTPLREGRLAVFQQFNRRKIGISTHAPAGGATGRTAQRRWCLIHFYSRPCGRGDLYEMPRVDHETTISTHAPAGGATFSSEVFQGKASISTHAPAGGATPDQGYYGLSGVFLLTPLREGRQLRPKERRTNMALFLLTPLREGRLRRVEKGRRNSPISTHAPAGGATRTRRRRSRWPLYFYSRPCGRGDVGRRLGRAGRDLISTHAPAGGATRIWSPPSTKLRNFYSRPCGRGDAGERAEYPVPLHFYSRPCGRGDVGFLRALIGRMAISTHAPAGGATFAPYLEEFYGDVFLLTPLREGRPKSSA